MNYCPKCGSKREGRFCGSCGFNFENANSTPLPASEGKWIVDPSDSSRERLWNGQSWTSQTRPVTKAAAGPLSRASLLRKLKYGPNYDKALNCNNCGKKLRRSSSCADCDL